MYCNNLYDCTLFRQPNEVTNGVISQSQHFFHSASGDLSPWVVIDLINPYAVVKIDYLTRINDKVAFDRCRGITASNGYCDM